MNCQQGDIALSRRTFDIVPRDAIVQVICAACSHTDCDWLIEYRGMRMFAYDADLRPLRGDRATSDISTRATEDAQA